MSDVVTEAEQYLAIDWSKEPQSEREAKIRAALLRRQTAKVNDDPFGAAIYLREQMRSGWDISDYASDLKTAWKVVEEACASERRSKKLREVEEAIREVDS
jgi:hypothetical protein